MYPQLQAGAPGCGWTVLVGGEAWVQCCCLARLLAPAACTVVLALGRVLGSRPCSLPAPDLLQLVGEGSQHSLLNRLGCTLCCFFPWHHALPGDTSQQPHHCVPELWATCQGTWTQSASVLHPHGVGAVCWELCANTLCLCPTGHLTFALGQSAAMADPPGCCSTCATCLLCPYSCQWIAAKKEKRKGLRTTKVIFESC